MNKIQQELNIGHAISAENYDEVIDYANDTQIRLIREWRNENNDELENQILLNQGILGFWQDSIADKKLYNALIRCGALIGTIETIEKQLYEKDMCLWEEKRAKKLQRQKSKTHHEGEDMTVSKEIWEEISEILKKYKIEYTAHYENRDVQRAMEYPDITVRDKHIQINLTIPNCSEES